jgi:hypothetical protein
VDGLVISCFSAKAVQDKIMEITITQLEEIIALIVANWEMLGRNDLN